MKWEKTGKKIGQEGTTITYAPPTSLSWTSPVRIESRKRHIQHANRSGTWDHTTYVVLRGDEELAEKQTLQAAKAYAERYMIDRGLVQMDKPERGR